MQVQPGIPNARFLDATQQTVAWFWKRLQADELEMQPPFQRNPVWQEAQKAYLIDSILRGYPVPELYLQTSVTADGSESHVVVDGQQRIRACVEYLADEYPLGDESGELSGQYFSDLDEGTRQQLFRYKFVVRALPSLEQAEVREIFGRLNRNNVALNRQELRQATYWGEFITTVTKLSQHSFWVKSGLFTSNDFRRMLDIEYVSELVVAALYGVQNKKDRLDRMYADFESEFPDREEVEEKFEKVLTQLSLLFEWPTNLRWSRKVDFYTLFVALADRSQDLPFDRDEAARTATRLEEFAARVSDVLSFKDEGEEPSDSHRMVPVTAYARGVRNSSDLGSRRMRLRALEEFVWPSGKQDDLAHPERTVNNLHLAKLPTLDSLLEPIPTDEGEDE
ncbi:DUF262 domain-containing protein [Micromonospora ureilytica]|uniref:DUF262 domain-containing protein n=1 Tax=Micromonospora ureilytica TaxID=709868 RepID=UPI00340F07A0